MAENGTSLLGQICWLEIPVANVSRAADFYASVLGWSKPTGDGGKSPLPGVSSVHVFNKGLLNGGFLLTEGHTGGGSGGAVTTFMVESIDDTLGKVEAAGGKVAVPKTAIGEGQGYFGRFVDTEGNVHGLWAKA